MTPKVFTDSQRRTYLQVAEDAKGNALLLTIRDGVQCLKLPVSAMRLSAGFTLRPDMDATHCAEVYARSELPKSAQALLELQAILGEDHSAFTDKATNQQFNPLTEVIEMHYILSKKGEFVSAHPKAKEAEQVLSKLPEDARANSVMVKAPEDLAQFSLTALVVLHNDHTAEAARVAKFKDKGTATVAAWAALGATFDPVVIKAAEKAAKDAAKAEEKAARDAAKAAAKAEKDAAKAAAGGNGAARAPRSTYTGKTITVVKADAGGRPGTWTDFMIKAILSSATCDEATAKVKAEPQYADRKPDFNWMQKQGYATFA